MFGSVEEAAEEPSKSLTKNFFRLKEDSIKQRWHSILEEDNSKAFEEEMKQTLTTVNCFITKIEIYSYQLQFQGVLTKEEEKKFKEYLAVGRELLTKLKVLASLEKASATEKNEQSHVRKLSYAATEDTTSVVASSHLEYINFPIFNRSSAIKMNCPLDTENVVDGHGGFSREESFDRRDSRMITLMHRYAETFTKHYDKFEKLNHDVDETVDRFNNLLDFIHQNLQKRTDAGSKNDDIVEKIEANEIIQNDIGEKERDVSIMLTTETLAPEYLLSEHLQRSSLVPIFRHVNITGSGHLLEHTYSCSVLGFYSEGKSRKKTRAKEEAAIQMLKQIIKAQKANNLPQHLLPFTEMELHELSSMLSEKEDFIEKLEENCLNSHEPPPLYIVLSEASKNSEPYYAIKCEAMGFTSVGHGSTKILAKKNAAKSILSLTTKRRKSAQVSFR